MHEDAVSQISDVGEVGIEILIVVELNLRLAERNDALSPPIV